MVCQGLDNAQVGSVWQPFFDWAKASPQDFFVNGRHWAGAFPARRYWDFAGNPFVSLIRAPVRPTIMAGGAAIRSRSARSSTDTSRSGCPRPCWKRSAAAFPTRCSPPAVQKGLLHFNKGLAGAPDEAIAAARDTATNPVVTEAFALAIIADGEGPRYPGLARPPLDETAARSEARAIDLAAAELRRIAPDAGSYVSESNYFNSSWQVAFWGSNYPRLLDVKAKYDPDGLFFVHHGVGSEEWSADGFARR